MPPLHPPVDYTHVFWRNLLNLAASLPLTMCVEAPAADAGMEALDLAHPFPLYRSGAWRQMREQNRGGMKAALMRRAIVHRKVSQWRAAPEELVLFGGLSGSGDFMRLLPRNFPFGVILHDNDLEQLLEDRDAAARNTRTLRRARLVMGFHPDVALLGPRLGLGDGVCHYLPHFIDLAFFKPHVQIEGVMRQFRLQDRQAAAVWMPEGRRDALTPLIDAWVAGGDSLQSRATLLVGFESVKDAEGFHEWATARLGAGKMPPWVKSAGEAPPNHLPYFFNAAAFAVHIPPVLERRFFAGWDIAAAAACGCPTLAPREGLHAQYITPATGALADCSSPESLLNFLSENSDWLEPASAPRPSARRAACRALAEDLYSPERFKSAFAATLLSISPAKS